MPTNNPWSSSITNIPALDPTPSLMSDDEREDFFQQVRDTFDASSQSVVVDGKVYTVKVENGKMYFRSASDDVVNPNARTDSNGKITTTTGDQVGIVDETLTMMALKAMVDGVNDKFNNHRPIYTQYLYFEVGGVVLVDTTSTEWALNNFVSLINEQNGSGKANKFTLNIVIKPNERNYQSIMELETILTFATQICKINEDDTIDYTQLKEFDTVLQTCKFQYGYGDDPILRSPEYSGMVLNWTSNISNGHISYTITGEAGVGAMQEIRISTKDEYLTDSSGAAITNPIDYVKRICEVEFHKDDGDLYDVRILDNVHVENVVAANDEYKKIDDKNIFQAINDILAACLDKNEFQQLQGQASAAAGAANGSISTGTINPSTGSLDYSNMKTNEISVGSSNSQCILCEHISNIHPAQMDPFGQKTYEISQNNGTYHHQTVTLFNQNVDMMMIGNRMLIATTSTFQSNPNVKNGSDGDYLDVYWSDGQIWHCIKGDTKNSGDSNWSKYGHMDGGKLNVVELIINSNPTDNPQCGGAKVTKIVNLGKYPDNPDYASNNATPITIGTTSSNANQSSSDTSGTSNITSDTTLSSGFAFDPILDKNAKFKQAVNEANNSTTENQSTQSNDKTNSTNNANGGTGTNTSTSGSSSDNLVPSQKNIFGFYISNAVTETSGKLGTIYIYRLKPRADTTDDNNLSLIDIDFAWFGYSGQEEGDSSHANYNHLVKEWTPSYEGKTLNSYAANINQNGINKTYPTLDADGNLVQVKGLGAVRLGLQSGSVNDIIHNIAQEYNQWAYQCQYPYKATMTTLGIPAEFPLTRYIRVTPKIYAEEHPSAGIYQMLGKKDIMNSSGFFTTWELMKYTPSYNPAGFDDASSGSLNGVGLSAAQKKSIGFRTTGSGLNLFQQLLTQQQANENKQITPGDILAAGKGPLNPDNFDDNPLNDTAQVDDIINPGGVNN